MKRISILLSIILIAGMTSFAQKKGKNSKNEMEFAKSTHDYGTMSNGANGTYQFNYTNTSKKPLLITNVKSSCGCTTPSFSKEPIQPGKSGAITVKYNTNLPGPFNKTIQVFSSAKNSPVRLTIKGKVLPKPGSGYKVLKGDSPVRTVNADKETEALEAQRMEVEYVDANIQKSSNNSKRKAEFDARKKAASNKRKAEIEARSKKRKKIN